MFKGAAKRPLAHAVDEIAAGKTIKIYGGYSIAGPGGENLDEYDAPPKMLALLDSAENCEVDVCVELIDSGALASFAVASAALLAFFCF